MKSFPFRQIFIPRIGQEKKTKPSSEFNKNSPGSSAPAEDIASDAATDFYKVTRGLRPALTGIISPPLLYPLFLGAAGRCSLVGGAVHGQFPYVLVGVEDDDVNFRREETEESHVRTQGGRHAQCRDLHLKRNKRCDWF
ncbi:hypothetical protein TNIN_80481 [Trichonephila inaurata madagascariensis]|uniref:Uncharacterized protein n=1 Tax=Trichonephila inaurata madagascariensis TaxID=2747483 RepID=A0A8X6Y3K1_9ARAC|nr:hypothetical protein TNIN_80481 [Trichonephila inaurata madagascariensis]